jgi:hypothetical protein
MTLAFLILCSASRVSAQTQITVAGVPVSIPADQAGEAPKWGTGSESILNVNASSFDTVSSGVAWTIAPGGARYITTPAAQEWIGGVSLPTGVLVTGFDVQGCDSSNAGSLAVLLVRQTTIGGMEGIGLVGTSFSSGGAATPGCGNFSHTFNAPVAIDNSNVGYTLDVQHGGVTDGSIRFTAVRIRYRLQVSPSPVAATFSDVPTSHPFFRFVEALAASGITAGCGGGNFCPDAPITRGQMAVFLAAALGLHFPN